MILIVNSSSMVFGGDWLNMGMDIVNVSKTGVAFVRLCFPTNGCVSVVVGVFSV